MKENAEINAFARGGDSDFNICIYTGVLEQVFLKISTLLVRPNSAKELEVPEPIKSAKTKAQLSDIVVKVIYSAWNYILLHEFSHIVLGHLSWLKSQHNLTCLFENGVDVVPDPKVHHVLEFQADAFAMGLSKGATDIEQFYSGVAVVIVHNLLADGTVFGRSFAFASHPHHCVRLMQLLIFVSKMISDDPSYNALRNWLLGVRAVTNALYVQGEERAVVPTIEKSATDFFSKVPQEIEEILTYSSKISKQMTPLHKMPATV